MAWDFELPAFGADSEYGASWKDTGNETFFGSNAQGNELGSSQYVTDEDWYDFGDDDWFVDSSGSSAGRGDKPWLSDAAGGLWDWLKSPQGTNVAAGALKGLMGLWSADLAERMKGNQEDDGPSDAELRDARIKVHNASINTPMDMGLVRFKR